MIVIGMNKYEITKDILCTTLLCSLFKDNMFIGYLSIVFLMQVILKGVTFLNGL